MFQSTAATSYEGNNIPTLAPGKYVGASFLGAKIETPVNSGTNETLKERITFGFKTADGQPFNHSELKPDDGDEKKAQNIMKRCGHILSKFYTPEQLVQANTTWDAYKAWVLQMASAANKAIKVDFIIAGSVYEGKARTGFPNFPPFIKKTGEDLGFSATYLKDKAEYDAHQNVQPDAQPGAAAATSATPNVATQGEF